MENKIIIGIGKGRDGTTSLSKNLEKIVELNKSKVKVHHEKFVKDIYNNFHLHFNNKLKLQEKNNKILNKFNTGNIYIGNGYILILRDLKKKFGNKLKVIRIYRNKKDWLKSFIQNVKFYPKKHGNYSNLIEAEIFRMAAFHFNEISFSNWNKLTLEKKLSWYYKKNNILYKNLKIKELNKLNISNKQLEKHNFLKKITNFINPKWEVPEKIYKVNVSKIDYKLLQNFDKKIVGTFYKNFDYLEAAKNPVYGLEFFLEKIKSGYKYREEYIHSTTSLKQLNYIKKILKKFLISNI